MLSVWPGQCQCEGLTLGVTAFPPHFISHQPGAPRWATPNLHKADCSCPAQANTKPRCPDFLDTTHRDRYVR